MASSDNQIESLRAAMAALEAQRGILGDTVVEAALKPLQKQYAILTAPSDERKRVTVLFADVSGFTAMSENLDPEEVTEIMNRCFERLSPNITRYGGTVDKYSGDAVMALFGAPKALENQEEMAVRAALAMQEALTDFSTELEQERGFSLRMRIGLNTGEVLAGLVGGVGDKDYTVMGDTVNLASRLEHACPVGRVMVSEATARPLHPVMNFEEPEQISVKGKAEPVTVYVVIAPKRTRGRLRGLSNLSSAMIGRDQELTALQDAFDLAMNEQHWQGIAVVGEAGVGKTRLYREFTNWVNQHLVDGVRILVARCYTHTQATPYYLVGELVREWFGIEPDENVPAMFDKLRKGLAALDAAIDDTELRYQFASLATVLGGDLPENLLKGLEPQQRQNRIFLSLERVFMKAARLEPVVIIADDLHWADDLSLSFWRRFLQTTGHPSIGNQPAMFLGISRPPDVQRIQARQFLTWLEKPPYQTLTLQLLNREQTRQLVVELLGQIDGPDEFIGVIAAKSQGNPFFVEELLRSFIEEGVLARSDEAGVWQVTRTMTDVHVPDSVYGVLATRLDRLSSEDKRTVQYAAIVGRTFWQQLLKEITHQSVEISLTKLTERQLVVRLAESQIADDWEWLFRHVLVQEVAYAGVTKAMQRNVHRMVAEWLEAHIGGRGEQFLPLIAYHYKEARVRVKGVHYLTLAAKHAAEAWANETALDWYAHARDVLASFEVRPPTSEEINAGATPEHIHRWQLEVLDGQATVQWKIGEHEAAQSNYLAALNLARLDSQFPLAMRADICYKLVHVHEAQGQFDVAWDWLQQGLTELDGSEPIEAARLYIWGGLIFHRKGQPQQAIDWCRRGIRIAEQKGAIHDQAMGQNLLGIIHRVLGDSQAALQAHRYSLNLYEQADYIPGVERAVSNLGCVYQDLEDWDNALECFERSRKLSEWTGEVFRQAGAYVNLGEVCRLQSDFGRAVEWYEQGRALAEAHGLTEIEGISLMNLGAVQQVQGDLTKALSALENSLQIFRTIDSKQYFPEVYRYLAEVRLAEGDYTEALSGVQHALHWSVELGRKLEEELAQQLLARIETVSPGNG